MTNYTFATLAIGEEYIRKVGTLIDCVMTLTDGDLIIITDGVEELTAYVNWLGYNPNRIIIKSFESVTEHRKFYSVNKFNFNLKILPTEVAYKENKYSLIIHADADAFFIGWNEAEIQKFIEHPSRGMVARFRNKPSDELGIQLFTIPKAKSLGLIIEDIEALMPIEVFMFFKPECDEFPSFMKYWRDIVDRCYTLDVDPFAEALEISYALSESKLPHIQLLGLTQDFPILNTLRYLHHDHIMRIF